MKDIKLSKEDIDLINKVLVRVINTTDSRSVQADAKKAFSVFLKACDESKNECPLNAYSLG